MFNNNGKAVLKDQENQCELDEGYKVYFDQLNRLTKAFSSISNSQVRENLISIIEMSGDFYKNQ